ncbi:MAG: 16S rRNA (guanine(966)-N(2))-methyltransferase RsmD [Pseudomonadales bacterium]|nr:16S rRNA (guanine(966)-N(2))-methyltransferase RsmD [Pseudomonadales bacterium]
MPRTHKARHISPRKNNRLRIIGGKWRGRKLAFPDLPGLRPTPDRVRETLFNWLTPVIHGARCLDLFAGSGALSLEALSRGAGHATLIDRAPKVITQLGQHLVTLKCQSAQLVQKDALQWLEQLTPSQIEPYNIIFLDPPFQQSLIEPSCNLLLEKNLLKPKAMIYIEVEASTQFTIPSSWQIFRETIAGQVASYLCSIK